MAEAADHAPEGLDAIVVGAGLAGLYMLHRLRSMGLRARCYEAGEGVGGTWFWNRYPGARCDVESMQYSYSFSEALQQEWVWTERYPSQAEILRYIDHVADRFDLRRDIVFNATVRSAVFDAAARHWVVTTAQGTVVSAPYCIMATGALSAVNTPEFPGLEGFRGRWFHTGRWPQEEIDFTGQRVAVIGTGSSGVQTIPVVAEQAAHLTVFQRTPNFSVPAWNSTLDPTVQAAWKQNYQTHRETARNTRSGILYEYSQRGAFDVSEAERIAEFERRWARGGANFTHAFNDIFTNRAANDAACEFVRDRIRATVRDPKVAQMLLPYDHAIGTKRICVDTCYFETFNRDNVTLVDVRATPIAGIEANGIRTSEGFHPLDSIIFATGYDALTGALSRIDVRGMDGQSLRAKWKQGPRTYLGVMSAGFPNLFLITGPGSPSILTNVIVSIEHHVGFVADCIAHMQTHGHTEIDPQPEAEDGWAEEVQAVAGRTLFPQSNSWFMGANIPGKPRVFLPYVGGFQNYAKICAQIVAEHYRGFTFH